MSEAQRTILRTNGILVARVLMGLLFVVSGWGMLTSMGVSGVATMIAGYGLPLASLLAVIMLAMKIGGGLALMLGYRTAKAAAVLIVFTLIATWFGHIEAPDFDQAQQIQALKNFAIIGGLLYTMAFGAGDGWKLRK